MNLVDRKTAKLLGLAKYFTGKPCRRGHVADRYIAGACCTCVSERKKELYEQNKEKILAYMKVQGAIYRANNPEKRLANSYKWRAQNKERVLSQERARRAANPEQIRKRSRAHYRKNREKEALRMKQWRADNKGLVNAFTGQRRAAILNRTPAWLTGCDRWIIKQAYELAALRSKMFGFPWHVDHVIPLRGKMVSGLHVPLNLQVIPGAENILKGNRA